MINQNEMAEVLQKHRGDAVVVGTVSASRNWHEMSRLPERDLAYAGALGQNSSFALGLALAQPDLKVILVNGDGALEMNLGTLCTISGKQPRNLYHFVMENGVYAATGGQPIAAQGRVSFADMAKAAGYVATYEFDDLEDFTVQIEEVLKQEGPVFVTIKAEPDIQNEPIARRVRPAGFRPMSEVIPALRESLGIA